MADPYEERERALRDRCRLRKINFDTLYGLCRDHGGRSDRRHEQVLDLVELALEEADG